MRELREVRDALAHSNSLLTALTHRVLEGNPPPTPRSLRQHEFRVTSQNGEDGVIHEIFKRIGSGSRVFVEIGMGDGVSDENNTAFLLSQGWRGYWVDGSPAHRALLAARPDLAAGITSHVGFVTRENVTDLLASLKVPAEFDLFSLDIDQNTWHVWDGLQGFRPRVVVVEHNASLPPDVDWVARYAADRVWKGGMNFGASLLAFERLGRSKGYSLVGVETTGANAFFVRDDLLGDHFDAPFTAEHHYQPPRYGAVLKRGHATDVLDRSS